MKNLAVIYLFIVFGGIIFSSCGNSENREGDAEADLLFNETCRLTGIYIDSMANAPDSTSLIAMMERYDAGLTSINFRVMPETDYHLSEGRNDTIAALIDSLRRVYDARLYRLAHPIVPDTVGADANTDTIKRISSVR